MRQRWIDSLLAFREAREGVASLSQSEKQGTFTCLSKKANKGINEEDVALLSFAKPAKRAKRKAIEDPFLFDKWVAKRERRVIDCHAKESLRASCFAKLIKKADSKRASQGLALFESESMVSLLAKQK